MKLYSQRSRLKNFIRDLRLCKPGAVWLGRIRSGLAVTGSGRYGAPEVGYGKDRHGGIRQGKTRYGRTRSGMNRCGEKWRGYG